jgi:hypothetical protein
MINTLRLTNTGTSPIMVINSTTLVDKNSGARHTIFTDTPTLGCKVNLKGVGVVIALSTYWCISGNPTPKVLPYEVGHE